MSSVVPRRDNAPGEPLAGANGSNVCKLARTYLLWSIVVVTAASFFVDLHYTRMNLLAEAIKSDYYHD